jgi:hypothetical protein
VPPRGEAWLAYTPAMFPGRRQTRCAAWIACAAIVASTLLPSLVRTAHAARGVPAIVAELCSSHGGGSVVIWAPSAPADDSSRQGTASPVTHCPGCLSSHDPGIPCTVGSASDAQPDRHLQPLSGVAQAPAAHSFRSAANPRAPPAAG